MNKTFKTLKNCFVAACLLSHFTTGAQVQLSFSGTPVLSGTAGAVGATYTYANVGTTGGVTIRAVVEIISLDNAGLDNIDGPVSAGGADAAFQPVIYGSQTANNCWSVRFRIRFFNATTGLPIQLSSYRASGVDIDGNASSLREHNTFYSPVSYTVQNPNNLTLTISSGAYRFQGPTTSYNGISLTQTNVAVTCLFNNSSSIDLSLGSCCVGGACNVAAGAGRQHSVNFFDAVPFSSPLVTLPVEIVSFSATESPSGTTLTWITADEDNLSHFIVQRSEDGFNFSDLGRSNATGTGSTYRFTDVTPVAGIAYYRLRSVDRDGHVDYSSIVSARRGLSEGVVLSVRKRGAGQSDLLIQTETAEELDINIYSSSGALLEKLHQRVTPGSHVIPVRLQSPAANGVLLVTVRSSRGWVKTVKSLIP